jgi:ABC-2 type transport system permease protein
MNRIGFQTLVTREIKRTFRIINQVIWPPLVSTLLYLFIFGFSLGQRIKDIEGVPYLEFLIPGLIIMSVIESSFSESSASLFQGRFTNSIQELLVAPLSYLEMVLGYVVGSVLRGLIIGNLIMALGWVVVGVSPANWGLYLLFMVLISAFFSCLGLVMGLVAESWDQLSIPTTFVITPLVFLGGVFNAPRLLPENLQPFISANPLYYLIDGFRGSMLAGWQAPVLQELAFLVLLTTFGLVLAMTLFRRGYKLRA